VSCLGKGSEGLQQAAVHVLSLTPLAALLLQGEVCDIDGKCVDAAEDEMFRLTTKEGKFSLEREVVRTDTPDFDSNMIFEQDPVQILDALLPLYMNSQVLRALQVSLGAFALLAKILL
jgi:F-type H+-transporting ATPase subunit gamma